MRFRLLSCWKRSAIKVDSVHPFSDYQLIIAEAKTFGYRQPKDNNSSSFHKTPLGSYVSP